MWDKAAFDRYYSFKGEPWGRPATRPGIRVHYNDFVVGKGQRGFSVPIAAALGGVNGASVAVIGAGFGWLCEGLTAQGATVVGTDISTWVIAEKDNTEEADLRGYIEAVGLDPDNDLIIGPSGKQDTNPLDLLLKGGRASPAPRTTAVVMDEDGSSNPSRRTIANAVGGSLDHIVTEEVLNGVTDAEGLVLCETLSRLSSRFGGQVTHILSPLQPTKNQAPELNWKLYDDWRTWLNSNGFAVHRIMPSVTVQNRTGYGEVF